MSKRAKKAALKAYPPKRKEVSMTGAIYTVVGGDFERRIFQEGYEQAEKDIKELIQYKIDSIGNNRERGYWLDAASELSDIIDMIDG